MSTRLKVGDTIPVSLQLENGATDQFPRAILYTPTGTVHATLDLAHVANGGYEDDSQTMPDLAFLRAVYIVFTDAGHTTESTEHRRAEEKWSKDTSVVAVIADTDDIQARLPAVLVSGRMDSSVGAMAAGTVTAAAIATDAIDSDAIAASAVTEIQAGLATSAALATVQTDTDDIQTRLPAALVSGRIDASVGAMAANVMTAAAAAADLTTELQAGLATSAALATVQADTDDIQARLPATLSGGRMRSQVEGLDASVVTAASIATDALGADELAASAVSEIVAGVGGSGDALGLLHLNSMIDNTVYNASNFMTSCRLRVFANAAAATAATSGAPDNANGETKRYLIDATDEGGGKMGSYRLVQVL